MKKAFWLLPVVSIVIALLSNPAFVNAAAQFELNVFSRNIIYDAAEGSGGGGIDIIWVILGSVIGILAILLVVTFVVLPRMKKGQSAKSRSMGGPGTANQRTRGSLGIGLQPRPAQPMPGMAPMPQGGMPQQPGMGVQPRPAQPVQARTAPPGVMPNQAFQAPSSPTRPAYPVPQQVPVQARPMQPMSPAPSQYAGIPVQGAPLFQVGNLVISPGMVKENEPVTISATIANQGSTAGQYKLIVRVNSVIEGVSELTINPGMSQIATFSVTRNVPGDYYVEADNLKGTFRVTPRSPAAFTISNLTINPDKVKQGEPAAISFIVTNSGDSPGYYTAVLKIKGIDEIVEDIPVEPNSSQMVTFNVIKDVAGFFPVSIENLTARFVVEMDWKI